MTQTIYLDSIDDLKELYAGIVEDWNQIDYADWLGKELDLMADLHKRYFDASAGPDGNAWGGNAPSTIAAKGHSTVLRGVRGKRAPKLKHAKRIKFVRTRWISGYRLATSLTVKSRQSVGDAIREAIGTEGGGSLTFGSGVEYAGDEFAGRRTAYAPQGRPHVGLNEQHLDGMTNRAADHALAQLAQ